MFDIAWSEMMLVGAVALVVIGPKDLPKALRTLGQAVGKVRRMATEFQGQFNDAMREAELDDLKKQVENVGEQVKSATEFDPIGQIRDDFDKPKSDPVSAEQAKLAELPAPDMPPPVEIPAAPIADPTAKPKRPRKVKADAETPAIADISAPVAAPPALEAADEKPQRVRNAKVTKAETMAAEPEPEAVPAPKSPRKRKATTVEPGEGSPA